MNRLFKNILIILFAINFNSCAKLNPDEISSNVTISGNGLVIIGNEGNFGSGNSSLSIYNKNSGEISNNIYQDLNQSLLGDVLHSINHINHELFLVINNSGKIIVINDENFQYMYQIENLTSPRKIIKVNETSDAVQSITQLHISVFT